jgi:hypothetical protein
MRSRLIRLERVPQTEPRSRIIHLERVPRKTAQRSRIIRLERVPLSYHKFASTRCARGESFLFAGKVAHTRPPVLHHEIILTEMTTCTVVACRWVVGGASYHGPRRLNVDMYGRCFFVGRWRRKLPRPLAAMAASPGERCECSRLLVTYRFVPSLATTHNRLKI